MTNQFSKALAGLENQKKVDKKVKTRTRLLLVLSVLSICFGATECEHAEARPVKKTKTELIDLAIIQKAGEYNLDPNLFRALLFQESTLRVSAVNYSTADYGIGQINIKNIRKLKLDKHRLLTDVHYSIEQAAKILSWFSKTYKAKEPKTWFCRYNIGTAPLTNSKLQKCKTYIKLVSRHLKGPMYVASISEP